MPAESPAASFGRASLHQMDENAMRPSSPGVRFPSRGEIRFQKMKRCSSRPSLQARTAASGERRSPNSVSASRAVMATRRMSTSTLFLRVLAPHHAPVSITERSRMSSGWPPDTTPAPAPNRMQCRKS